MRRAVVLVLVALAFAAPVTAWEPIPIGDPPDRGAPLPSCADLYPGWENGDRWGPGPLDIIICTPELETPDAVEAPAVSQAPIVIALPDTSTAP